MSNHWILKTIGILVIISVVGSLLSWLAVFALTFAAVFSIVFGILMASSAYKKRKAKEQAAINKAKAEAQSQQDDAEQATYDTGKGSPIDILAPLASTDPDAIEIINAYNDLEQLATLRGVPLEPIREEFNSKFLTAASLMKIRSDYSNRPDLYPDASSIDNISASLSKFKQSIIDESKDLNVKAVLDAQAGMDYLNDNHADDQGTAIANTIMQQKES
jgi:type III secretory pathway component EscV